MSYFTPAPNPAPDGGALPRARLGFLGTVREWLKALGPYAALVVAFVYLRSTGQLGAPAPPPDRIEAAAKAWRKAEGPAYRSVAEKIRTGQIVRLDQVDPALKEAFLPTAREVTDSVSSSLKVLTDSQGNFTNQLAAAEVLDRTAKAFEGK